jgi:hypothetical protein
MNRIAKNILLMLLRGYKWALSPMLPPACRYVPTCSEYAIEAVERYGALRGGAIVIWRLLHCHPFASGGFDPVPVPVERISDAALRRTAEGGCSHTTAVVPTIKSHA